MTYDPDLWPSDILILAFLVFNSGDLYYLGYKNNNNERRSEDIIFPLTELRGQKNERTKIHLHSVSAESRIAHCAR